MNTFPSIHLSIRQKWKQEKQKEKDSFHLDVLKVKSKTYNLLCKNCIAYVKIYNLIVSSQKEVSVSPSTRYQSD
ncbi:hypothetical protein MYP_1511 [Sporocytophaga myxococcoides]|uniref:Uncharacterized protein n=1 Tax=Sporocytophaga myxococcoides TaxID=153721 RepID=A0A098LD08_9BACT|nr:hypothetical protein MYP_1511 [Sporocytophaga myxococcoides]